MSDAEYGVISDHFNKSIQSMKDKKELLAKQMEELDKMKQFLNNLPQEDKRTIMIESEPGSLAKKTKEEALTYVNQKFTQLKKVFDQFDEKINEANITKENFDSFKNLIAADNNNSQNKINEEGLPFIDIQEEIDEEGDIVGVKVNNEEFDYKSEKEAVTTPVLGTEQTEGRSQSRNNDKLVKKYHFEAKENDDHGSNKDDQVEELFEDMELYQSRDRVSEVDQEEILNKIDKLDINSKDKFDLKTLCVREFNKTTATRNPNNDDNVTLPDQNVLDGFQRGENQLNLDLDRSNLIELELLADDLNGSENSEFEDDEELDYDFDDDDEYEEDDVADEVLYQNGRDFSFGKSDRSNNLLWEQIQKLRESKVGKQDHVKEISEVKESKKTKNVRFAPELQIKEIENVSEILKNVPDVKKVSLFKQQKMTKPDLQKKSALIEQSEGNENVILQSSEGDHPNDTSADKVMEDVIIENESSEDTNDVTSAGGKSNDLPRKSRFKTMRLGSTNVKNEQGNLSMSTDNNADRKTNTERFVTDTSKNSNEESNSKQSDAIIEITNNIKDTSLDYYNLQQDNDTMAKAYVLGMYDDDIVTEGPVVNKLEDFVELNQIVEFNEKLKEDQLKEDDNGKMSDSDVGSHIAKVDESKDETSNEDQDLIMTDDIIEHDLDDDNDYDDDDVDVDYYENDVDFDEDDDNSYATENEVLNQEIRENYFRLRSRMIANQNGYKKSSEEMEIEPIDEEGNPIKVSRFKSARLNR